MLLELLGLVACFVSCFRVVLVSTSSLFDLKRRLVLVFQSSVSVKTDYLLRRGIGDLRSTED